MQPYSDALTDRYGNAIKGASVLVKTAADVEADLFDDAGAPLDNPLTTDDNGRFAFRAANGRYTLNISGPGLNPPGPIHILLDDPATVRAEAVLDFGLIAAHSTADLTMAVVGALAGSPVKLGVSAAPEAGISFTAFCVTADEVTIRAQNVTAGGIDPAPLTFDAEVTN